MINKKVKKAQQGSAHLVGILLVVIIIIVALGYVGFKSRIESNGSSNQPTLNTQDETEEVTNARIGTMSQQVKMQMPKAEVESKIGQPFACTEPTQAEDTSVKYEMQRCRYGNANASKTFEVIYMNGAVWGTTSTNN